MIEALQNAVNYVQIPLAKAIQMATLNVAKAIGMETELGKIEPGYPATFLVFNKDLSACKTLVLS
jgi:N-acetylglucosamine-6-phosphate deacetylase